jgi:hypothetical protein
MYSPEDNNIYSYDVNSLYPFIISSYPMPIGALTYFEGDIRKFNPNTFGIFYCKIINSNNLIHPIIQTHVKFKGGIITISPLGTRYNWLSSLELDNAFWL